MAEAMELDLTLKKIVDETIKNPIVPPELDKDNAINEKNEYSIEAYYGDDNLGIDVLKQNIWPLGKNILTSCGSARPKH